ncbi:GHKL domain-containing protein [Brevibacillus fluminis]|uniref:histidine kinase n=1 Tax=Brevibacillus fluminis TaxID=511487 RepID=A0A3M8D5Z3_9BACL|nr:HAMP domain-containing sensor histidine kinase [Brevibacillus fluminis]RNB83328.1 GHKL domain-containing protein [Brevibacillus fluminis]
MMVIIWLVIWTLGFLVLFTDPKQTSIRWASATAFIGGCGFFSAVVDETLYPLFDHFANVQTAVEPTLMFISRLSSFICQVGLPYAFFMFAIHSGDFIVRKTKKLIQYLALIPPLFVLATTPIYPVLSFNYWVMVSWALPYFLAASVILIVLYRKEKDPQLRRSRLFTNILVIVPLMFVFTTIYIMRTQNQYEAWRYNMLIVGIQFLLILFISVKYGFLGVKFRVERRRLHSTLRALTSGAQIVNHTIKNEIGKITLFADRIQSYAIETNQPDLKKDVDILIQSSQHILDMMNRIQGQLQEITIKEEVIRPAELIDEVLRNLKPYAEKYAVVLETDLDVSLLMRGDPVQLREILTNLCMNAFEAMKEAGGTLILRLYLSKKHLVISVTDTGVGISKENLPHVMDPFFSTKKTGQNYGLGLSYCFNVMQKHQGTLEIYSIHGEGTTIYLYFPRKRLATN